VVAPADRRDALRVAVQGASIVVSDSILPTALKVGELLYERHQRDRLGHALLRLITKRYVSRADLGDLGMANFCRSSQKVCQALVQKVYDRARSQLARTAAKRAITAWGGPVFATLSAGAMIYDLNEFHSEGTTDLAIGLAAQTKRQIEAETNKIAAAIRSILSDVRKGIRVD